MEMRHETDTRPDQHRLMIFVEQLQSQGMSEREINDTLCRELEIRDPLCRESTEERTTDPTRRYVATFKTQLLGGRFNRS
jgi:hypothetical protein